VVHVLFLVGFRNRISVLLSWMWNYLISSRGARLITGKTELKVKEFARETNL
jgi:NADH dehydrogenase